MVTTPARRQKEGRGRSIRQMADRRRGCLRHAAASHYCGSSRTTTLLQRNASMTAGGEKIIEQPQSRFHGGALHSVVVAPPSPPLYSRQRVRTNSGHVQNNKSRARISRRGRSPATSEYGGRSQTPGSYSYPGACYMSQEEMLWECRGPARLKRVAGEGLFVIWRQIRVDTESHEWVAIRRRGWLE